MRTRSSAFVEDREWADTGCDLAPACLTCPFERCRYDGPVARELAMVARRERFQLARRETASPTQLAAMAGVSKRTVYRFLAEAPSPVTRAAPGGETTMTSTTQRGLV